MVIVPYFVGYLSSRLRVEHSFGASNMDPQLLTVVFFVQLVNTLSGSLPTGNEHLHGSVLGQNEP